jgi:hypothetical protein
MAVGTTMGTLARTGVPLVRLPLDVLFVLLPQAGHYRLRCRYPSQGHERWRVMRVSWARYLPSRLRWALSAELCLSPVP